MQVSTCTWAFSLNLYTPISIVSLIFALALIRFVCWSPLAWSSLVEGDECFIGTSSKLLRCDKTKIKYAARALHHYIHVLFNCLADPVAHLLLLKSSMPPVIERPVEKSGSQLLLQQLPFLSISGSQTLFYFKTTCEDILPPFAYPDQGDQVLK